MKKNAISLVFLLSLSAPVFAAPAIDFAAGLGWPSFNDTKTDNTSFGGIAISGFTYNSTSGAYNQNYGYLWLRNNDNDHGLGYCSKYENCGSANTTGSGDSNELSNESKNEILRLTRPDGKAWSDIWLSSLDSGGTSSNETGTLYWSDSATPVLSGGIVFSHSLLGSASEGSLFSYFVTHGLDVNAKNLFFRAGSYAANGTLLNGTNNDYLVYGVNVTNAVPEPEIYAMLAAGLGLMHFIARRRQQKTAVA